MNVLSWNCRGFRKASAVQRCKRLAMAHYPNFLYLSETKISVNHVASSLKSLGYVNFVGTDAVSKGGGTFVGWKNDISADVLDLSLYYCHMKVNGNQSFPSYYITFIYGPPVQSNRYLLWDWIKETAKTITEPWVLLGDFNQIISAEDKISNNGTTSGINIFKETMDEADLSIINHHGPNFTWTNKRKSSKEYLERIDLAFCNSQWSALYPCCFVQHTYCFTPSRSTKEPRERNLKNYGTSFLSVTISSAAVGPSQVGAPPCFLCNASYLQPCLPFILGAPAKWVIFL